MPSRLKRHRLGQQCVGADDQVHVARGQAGEQGGPLAACGTVGEQFDPHLPLTPQRPGVRYGEPGQHRLQRNKVLFGQDFGRGHQGALVPPGHGRKKTPQGNQGFPGAHVALQ